MNFNVNVNVLLNKYIVHPLVKIKRTVIIIKSVTRLTTVLGFMSTSDFLTQ